MRHLPSWGAAAAPDIKLGIAMKHLLAALLFSVSTSSSAQSNVALLLFGGKDHKSFLGCLNCNQYSTGSVCNKYGEHGSKYSSESIWNKYGNFGSRYSGGSPWNKYASEPPVIVDKEGKFYGYLTANPYNSNRTRIKLYVALTDLWEEITDDSEQISDKFCGRE